MKTSKQIYEAIAIELNKVHAHTLKLYEFNYFVNQAINQFVNKVYNIYDTNQQTTDDLRVLKSTASLLPKQYESTGNPAIDYLRGATYYVEMPDDYLHLLNCICLFNVNSKKDCWNKGDVMVAGATRLTADSWSSVMEDFYNRPTKKHPYYYIHNQNDIYLDESDNLSERNSELPTNLTTDRLHSIEVKNEETDEITTNYTGFSRTFDFNDSDYGKQNLSTFEKSSGLRQANASKVKVEIRCGQNNSDNFNLAAVQIEYIKAPQYIKLTQEQLDSDKDISQILEFPDYVIQEIINELVNLIMRKNNDPSLNTHIQMTQSIARPTGQQQ